MPIFRGVGYKLIPQFYYERSRYNKKVAMSASFFNEPNVKALLHSCDKIYTTMVKNYPILHEEFGDRVHIIPDGRMDLIDFLMAREQADNPDVVIVTYHDLYLLHVAG